MRKFNEPHGCSWKKRYQIRLAHLPVAVFCFVFEPVNAQSGLSAADAVAETSNSARQPSAGFTDVLGAARFCAQVSLRVNRPHIYFFLRSANLRSMHSMNREPPLIVPEV